MQAGSGKAAGDQLKVAGEWIGEVCRGARAGKSAAETVRLPVSTKQEENLPWKRSGCPENASRIGESCRGSGEGSRGMQDRLSGEWSMSRNLPKGVITIVKKSVKINFHSPSAVNLKINIAEKSQQNLFVFR
jgi:hypothetical protein